MEPELKNEESLKALETFGFKTDLPMQALFIVDGEQVTMDQKGGNRIIETTKADARANDGRKRVRLTASSDATDLVGDVMSKNALNQMKNAAVGTTIFMNHDATVPESVFGAVEKAELVTRNFEVIEGGKTKTINLLCLEYDVVVEETQDRALKVWEIINAGTTKLGASITIAITEKSPLSGGRRLIDGVIYLETSIVGIPCNQTAWVNYVKNYSWIKQAQKSLRSSVVQLSGGEPVDIDALLSQPATEVKTAEAIPPTSEDSGPGKSRPFFLVEKAASETQESIMNELRVAKTVKDAMTAFKGLYNEAVDAHFENPWLYMYLLEDCMMELIYWNSNMPKEDKVDAANEMIDEFKMKMMEILNIYWSDDDDEKSISLRKQFDEAATKQLQFMMKEGRRNNTGDQKTIQTIHDMSCSLGAGCCEEKAMKPEETAVLETAEQTVEKAADAAATEIAVQVNVMDAPEVQAMLAETKKQIEELEAKNIELETKIAELEAANKNLDKEAKKWKAGAYTAKAMLANHLNQPATRPGASSN